MRAALPKYKLSAAAVVVLALAGAAWVGLRGFEWTGTPWAAGKPIGSFDGVEVYDNGPVFAISHGRHYARDGYYFGQKWQCVEFIKRYLYEVFGHRMPDAMGHAVSFFDPAIAPGMLNPKRDMVQFAQGGMVPPEKGDLIVFGGAAGYGHVGIVINATADTIEVAQQNKPPVRELLRVLPGKCGGYLVDAGLPTLGWLRLPAKVTADAKASERPAKPC